ncbi:MAG: protein translocase subunit SecD [Gemmataceae bacterium]|nr:protein translocase subunit SecD [Gemmataceae bacterium]
MKSFFWRTVICVVPCLLAAWVVSTAVARYLAGESGGFKLGTDLVGGTNLVYEIDKRKTAEDAPEGKEKTTDVGVLAEALKRRIDPNDLYNVTIRPAGGENRVEIVLPTGGAYRAEKSEKTWRNVVDTVTKKYEVQGVDVPRGRTLELVDRIQIAKSQKIWDEKLFSNPETFKRAKTYSIEYWAELDPNVGTADRKMELAEGWQKLEGLKADRLEKFTLFLRKELAPYDVNDKSIDIFVKKLAWNELIERVKANPEWKGLNLPKEELAKIPPDATEQLIALIQGRGTPLGLAGITVIEQVLGNGIFPKGEDNIDRESILAFVNENYGPSGTEILRDITKASGKTDSESKDLTVEEVQRIKDLVSKVGSLEFRILANGADDKEAIAEVESHINSKVDQEELKKLAEGGLPPPSIMDPNEPTKKKYYDVALARGEKSRVSYTWVELGPQERAQLNLNNSAKNDPARSRLWLEADRKRGKATKLPDPYTQASNKFILNGALFFSRPSLDRNLPEEERRSKAIEYFVLARDPELGQDGKPTPTISGKYLVSAFPSPDSNGRMVVSFTFDSTGGDLFGNLTGKNVPTGEGPADQKIMRHLAIVLDGLVMSAPTINSQIRQSGQITGNFTQKETENLVNILRAGRLPATLKPQPVSETTMGPTLGEDTIRKGVSSVLFAFLGVLIFMIVYYRFAGLVASIALIANLLLTIGFMVAVQATFTLPGLAGLVLTLGMAVDANVLIYERLREERERGASLILALRNGYDHALPTIIDTHLSSIFTAVVLYIVGNDQLKGFGVSLTVGLVISLFTSLYMTRLMFDFWQHKGWLTKLSMMRLFAKPSVDFMAIRNAMFTVTLIASIVGLVLFIGRIPNDLNIDFVGGTAFGGELVKPLTTTELRDKVDEKRQGTVLKVESVKELEENRYQITYGGGQTRVVALANRPVGDNAAAREADLKARASQLPDVSVEQIFLAKGNAEGNRSANFVIRTSEREAELVQASIDRLLTEDSGSSLLKRMFIKADPMSKRETRFYFFEEDHKTPAYASTNFVRSLLRQELKNQDLPGYDLIGEGTIKEDGRSQVVRLRFENELKGDKQKNVQTAVEQVVARFNERPQPDRLENFDSTLARETQFRAMYAVLASWGAILLYLWFRFGSWTFGLAAVLCLIHDLCFTLGMVAVCHYLHGTFLGDWLLLDDFKIDLPAVAALLTLVGYSVNDTIVVFDRIREVRGKSPELTEKMINDSINQTLSRTVLASLTTFIVVLVLFIWGGPGVHLFAFVMVVGVLVGTYSSIYIASPLLLMLGEGVPQQNKFSTAIKPAPQPA